MTPQWHDNDNGVPEEDLQAYVDGELDHRRRAAVEAYLATNPAEAARLAAYRAQNIGLHALFDPDRDSSGQPVPPEMEALARRLEAQLRPDDRQRKGRGPQQSPKTSSRRSYRAVAASVAVMLTAGTVGWLALQQNLWSTDPLVAITRQAATEQTASAESTGEAPLQLASTAAESGDSTANGGSAEGAQQVVSWLAAQPGTPPTRLPDLETLGYELVAERIITTQAGKPAAQLLYQNGDGQRVTLLIRAGGTAGKTSFTFTREGEAAQFFWQDSHMAYSLMGKMAQDELLKLAEAVSRSFQKATEPPAAPEKATQPATLEPAVQSEQEETEAPLDNGTQEQEAPLPLPENAEEVPKET